MASPAARPKAWKGERNVEPAFSLENVTKRFRRADGSWNEAIAEASLAVRPGESLAVIGPNGAGKTTLLRLLNLTLRPDAGRVRVDGVDPAGLGGRALRRLRARTATVFQQHHLVPSLRVVHNILAGRLSAWPLPLAAFSLIFPREMGCAAEAAAQVGLLNHLWERTDRLSGGEQQRVAIARALAQSPRHILADEPVASVDPSRSDAVIALLRELSDGGRKTLIVNLHDVALALRHFPRIVGLREGRVLFDLPPERIEAELLARLYEGDAVFGGDTLRWLNLVPGLGPAK